MSNEKGLHLKDATVKRKGTVISSITDNVTLMHFEEQKRILNSEFQDIEDQIVGFYLMTKPNTLSTKRIRKKIQKQLVPLYNIVRDSLEMSLCATNVQMPNDAAPPDAKRMKTSEVAVDDQNITTNETIFNM